MLLEWHIFSFFFLSVEGVEGLHGVFMRHEGLAEGRVDILLCSPCSGVGGVFRRVQRGQ